MKIQIALTVPIVLEDRLALIAATHDVIERTGNMYLRISCRKRGGEPEIDNHKIAIRFA